MPSARSNRWCFTLNNYAAVDEQHLSTMAGTDAVEYLVFGREVGDNGTPHLQGFVYLSGRRTLDGVRALLSARAHFEPARSTNSVCADYCKKDGDYEEFGTYPSNQGRRTDWDSFKQWVLDLGRVPSPRQVAANFPHLWARSHTRCLEIAEAYLPRPRLVPEGAVLHEWQQNLRDAVLNECPDDRGILFYVDPDGGKGKSFFVRYMLTHHEEEVQMLGVGKVTDIAYLVDPNKSIFLIDCERSSAEFLPYRVLEQIKNRLVVSTKYSGFVKTLRRNPHVVVFMNEEPDMTKLTDDRYTIINL